ncbi:2-nitropropane dioxygenase [Caenispirillum salinarum AK4]|uniref:2-nitropropane dioxygenase n=1 Tax=Caenispirillum salinarum AK4 TaxID=1238182 RepID=K9GVQ9_9PROT|nr:nitronate monooxygenase [Caenispirillum salinarum]EKV30045.1 2-nitropropane dioxygenase [Caenispirillum salinarum AK4]
MPIPAPLRENLRLPAIAAPMFLVSGPELVIETCKAGMIGTFPALNARSTESFEAWIDEIEAARAAHGACASYGVNLIVHKTNPRLEADLDVVSRRKVPLVITSLGAVPDLVEKVHAHGGKVFHDVITLRHAKKAAQAGVDGLILVCAGAGGHAGTASPFALIEEVRSFFSGTIILAGSISTGRHVAAARMMGADLAYMGTRFIATAESRAVEDYKQMIHDAQVADIVYTDSVSGVNANFLRESLIRAGLDPQNLPPKKDLDMAGEAKAWRDIWSAGHGVASIRDVPHAGELVARLEDEYKAAFAETTALF